ncbi:calmodulin-binding protein [Streptomyces sp. LN785]|uniref:BP74-related protein n=1 Tax=Streptomyces sp. LN785 TaxID=3112983 RepID=UPI00371164E0
MRRFTLKLGTIAAATLLALAVGPDGPAQATAPTRAAANTAYFNLRDIQGANFTILLNDAAKIREAREIVADGLHKIVVGRIVKTTASYNPQWDFHLNPDTVTFADMAIEVCDATVRYTNDHLDEAGGPFLPGLYWCPWTGRLTAEVPAP